MNKMNALRSSALVAMTYILTSPVFAQSSTEISAEPIVGSINKGAPILVAVGSAIIALSVIGLIIAFTRRTAGGR